MMAERLTTSERQMMPFPIPPVLSAENITNGLNEEANQGGCFWASRFGSKHFTKISD